MDQIVRKKIVRYQKFVLQNKFSSNLTPHRNYLFQHAYLYLPSLADVPINVANSPPTEKPITVTFALSILNFAAFEYSHLNAAFISYTAAK